MDGVVHWRLFYYPDLDGEIAVCEMQWFDELNCAKDRMFCDAKFETEEAAERAVAIIDRIIGKVVLGVDRREAYDLIETVELKGDEKEAYIEAVERHFGRRYAQFFMKG